MKKKSWTYPSILFLILIVIMTPGCGKQKLSSDAPSTPSAPASQIPDKGKSDKPADKTDQATPNVSVPSTAPSVSNAGALSVKPIGWGLSRNSEHKTPGVPAYWVTLLNKYNGYYVGDVCGKNVYLTFDEGYENGYTSKILDILHKEQVKAAFFVTRPYIKGNSQLVKRMVDEGHIVGNHTATHPGLAALPPETIELELSQTADTFKEVTGSPMAPYMRPPMGQFSERSLAVTNELGYKTIFWSLALADWDPKNQPGKDKVYQTVMNNIHPGAIILLHAVSQSDTEALPDIIHALQEEGYTFRSLDELPPH